MNKYKIELTKNNTMQEFMYTGDVSGMNKWCASVVSTNICPPCFHIMRGILENGHYRNKKFCIVLRSVDLYSS